MIAAWMGHWQEYAMEAALLALFMVSACVSVAIVEHPSSWVRGRVGSAVARRLLIGLAMGATAVMLISSPWGARSGAHMNPATTLAFLTLGRIAPADAAGYVVAQCAGGIAAVWACAIAMPGVVRHPAVGCVVTAPREGRGGRRRAWAAEYAMSTGMMLTGLVLSNSPRWAWATQYAVGLLLAAFITIAAPVSGMSINPARTLASAVPSRVFRAVWIYVTAPVLGMVSAAGAYAATAGPTAVACGKLNHAGSHRCIFRCDVVEGGVRDPGR